MNSYKYYSLLVPLIPTGFMYTREYHGTNITNLTFEWYPPQGTGPESIVDNYTISVSPGPLSHPSTNVVPYPPEPWNVTLAHNTEYKISIRAENCAGQGDTFALPTIEYSKLQVWNCCLHLPGCMRASFCMYLVHFNDHVSKNHCHDNYSQLW